MNPDALAKLNDQEIRQLIAAGQSLLETRAEKRRNDAMEQIRKIAADVQINVSFDGGRKVRSSRAPLKAGDCYVNPADKTQSYIVGKGKPPQWFAALREKGRLPAPVTALPPKEV